MASGQQRIPLVDAIKAVSAQLIVLHHLAWYGPMSDVAANLSPVLAGILDWLAAHGRYAVAAFLAMGGYLAAQTLSPRGLPSGETPGSLILQRYLRLIVPYAVALVLAVFCAALARQWMVHESIGAPSTLGQFVAHLFLLQDLIGFEALSAGVWYIAIDFQLYALLVVLVWASSRRLASADIWVPASVLAVALASLFVFNRDPAWDATALYFFAAYALGVGSGWAVRTAQPYRILLALGTIGLAALFLEFRPRIAVALVIALSLGLAHRHLRTKSGARCLASFSNSSYALFLVHFPVCLLINAALHRLAPRDPGMNVLGLLVAWLASNVVALLFHRHIEVPMVPMLSEALGSRQAVNR
jgi:peptidoglycan/LPS O-acetylase OafA/YrhL